MKFNKKKVVIGIFLLGMLFMLISILFVSYFIPKANDEVDLAFLDKNTFDRNLYSYDQSEADGLSTIQGKYILWQINPSSPYVYLFENLTHLYKLKSVSYSNIMLTGKIHSPEQYAKWEALDNHALEEEKNRIWKNFDDRTKNISARIRKATSERDSFSRWSLFFQILGFLISQFAILLQILWDK